MNYLMLMMVDKQVNCHVIPRYQRTINFSGLDWEDLGWPGVPSLVIEKIDGKVLNEIKRKIKENLSV